MRLNLQFACTQILSLTLCVGAFKGKVLPDVFLGSIWLNQSFLQRRLRFLIFYFAIPKIFDQRCLFENCFFENAHLLCPFYWKPQGPSHEGIWKPLVKTCFRKLIIYCPTVLGGFQKPVLIPRRLFKTFCGNSGFINSLNRIWTWAY